MTASPKKKSKNLVEKVRANILLKNLIMAISLGIILIFLVNLSLNLYTRHGQKFYVPNFIGTTVPEAAKSAKGEGKLQLEVIDSLYMPKQKPGIILDQSPKPGMGVKSGRRVFITVNAFRPRMEVVPYVTGYSVRQAKNLLENKGFEIERLVYKSDIATNNVLDQQFNDRSIDRDEELMAELGSGITLVVGVNSESPLPRVPKVIGLSLRDAKSRLWEVGLNVGTVKFDSDITVDNLDEAKIYKQEPNQQSRSHFGSNINLWLTTKADKLVEYNKESDAAARRYAVDEEEELDSLSDEAVDSLFLTPHIR